MAGTACCMPPDHCVGIPHPHRYRHRPCFYRYARLSSLSEPFSPPLPSPSPLFSCHHLPLHHHCSLCHHQMEGLSSPFPPSGSPAGACPGSSGGPVSPSPGDSRPGSAAAWPSRCWRRRRCLRLRQWSWWTWRRRWWRHSRRQWYLPLISLTLVRPQWCWLPSGLTGGVSVSKGSVSPGLGAVLSTGSFLELDPPPGVPPVESPRTVEFLGSSSPS